MLSREEVVLKNALNAYYSERRARRLKVLMIMLVIGWGGVSIFYEVITRPPSQEQLEQKYHR